MRRYLTEAGGSHVLKIALVRPSAHPLFDLDYRFVQALPDGPDRFDFRGSCGHSILSAVVSAERAGILPALTAGGRVRVNVLNNGDSVVCEMEEQRLQPRCGSRLLRRRRTAAGAPADRGAAHRAAGGRRPAAGLHRQPLRLRRRAGPGDTGPHRAVRRRGRAVRADGAAAGGRGRPARLVPGRCLSQDRGDPPGGVRPHRGPRDLGAQLAPDDRPDRGGLSGAATRIPGTVPWRIAQEAGRTDGPLGITTPGGRTTVTAATHDIGGQPALTGVGVGASTSPTRAPSARTARPSAIRGDCPMPGTISGLRVRPQLTPDLGRSLASRRSGPR